MRGAVSGMTMKARIPSRCAASATPCAWFPADDAIPPRLLLPGQRRELVAGAADLEREDRLKVLALEPHLAAEPGGELRCEFQRRFARHVVDARLVARALVRLGGRPERRKGFVTDNGNEILVVHGLDILDPPALESEMNQIVGAPIAEGGDGHAFVSAPHDLVSGRGVMIAAWAQQHLSPGTRVL